VNFSGWKAFGLKSAKPGVSRPPGSEPVKYGCIDTAGADSDIGNI